MTGTSSLLWNFFLSVLPDIPITGIWLEPAFDNQRETLTQVVRSYMVGTRLMRVACLTDASHFNETLSIDIDRQLDIIYTSGIGLRVITPPWVKCDPLEPWVKTVLVKLAREFPLAEDKVRELVPEYTETE